MGVSPVKCHFFTGELILLFYLFEIDKSGDSVNSTPKCLSWSGFSHFEVNSAITFGKLGTTL